eukprot:CAMPEP_0201545192 /NCGR_PEP_ID=MMETSP0173_2-20130828/1730_1 /ASSEMBLY_ACC=CAM_ASM_000268 /TAXON_ID=218659 /ORGANISM="Vexillifera sp., Strain DIVA3 564/2" /LENGTH=486 /DNA_ID=CAMNT_0047953525 /DNA_START=150 /DNA_END=1610 /DNA_ORIENTATION=+
MLDMKLQIGHLRWMGAEKDRVMKDVPAVETTELSSNILFGKGKEEPAVHLLTKHLHREGRLEVNCALQLIETAAKVLRDEPNVLELKSELRVVGDIHGQFYDLLNLFDVVGDPKSTQYLFLGDYVDRGMFGVETVFVLFAYKILYRDSFHLLRGNHESREITDYFNFQEECYVKYNQEVYDAIMNAFDCLPIAALVDTNYGKFLCTHGGLGPGIKTIDDIRQCNRFQEPPETGVFCDLLWSDPIDIEEFPHMTDHEYNTFDFLPNNARGVGWIYGRAALEKFLSQNSLNTLVRAHEVQQYGYTEHRFGNMDREFPLAITVFSAPNYCDMYENRGGVMIFGKDKYRFEQTAWVDHPYWLPDFMNAFSFSLPYVADNCATIVFHLLMNVLSSHPSGSFSGSSSDDSSDSDDDQVWSSIKAKFESARKQLPQIEEMRKQRAAMVLPQIPLLKDGDKISFKEIRKFDRKNESRPPRKHLAKLRRAKSAHW